MSSTFKNRLTIEFGEEPVSSMKIEFATVEQEKIFIEYLKLCTDMHVLKLKREVRDTTGWKVMDTLTLTAKDHHIKRASKSPFKLEIRIPARASSAECRMYLYTFSSMDLDILGMLITSGTSNKDILVTGYYVDKETKEWKNREFSRLVPQRVSKLFNELSDKNKVDAIDFMYKLKSMS